jgi:hypothetical protein
LNYSQSLFKSIYPSVYSETGKLKEVKCYIDGAVEPEYGKPLEFGKSINSFRKIYQIEDKV